MARNVIIGIGGVSGCGKTTLANYLKNRFKNKVGIINTDSYYNSFNNLTKNERDQLNFDNPSMLDLKLLLSHLSTIKCSKKINIPQYNFVEHKREKNTIEFIPKSITIVEGIFALCFPELNQLFNLKIFIDIPLDICIVRRMSRDITERGRTPDSVVKQYLCTVRPMAIKFIYPSKKNANLIVDYEKTEFSSIETKIKNYLNYYKGVK